MRKKTRRSTSCVTPNYMKSVTREADWEAWETESTGAREPGSSEHSSEGESRAHGGGCPECAEGQEEMQRTAAQDGGVRPSPQCKPPHRGSQARSQQNLNLESAVSCGVRFAAFES